MATILSCGHREDNERRQFSVMTKDWSKDHKKAVAYQCVCLHCLEEYERDNMVLYDDAEAMRWLRG